MSLQSNEIQFILDNQIITIDFSDAAAPLPTTTLLNYLRSIEGHKGVKEGCAEGDCGACTVVIAESDGRGGLSYRNVDSCLVFLPMIHGKWVITVENLAITKKGQQTLHPVQEALIKTSGTQCGYCTPGIVMTMFSLFKNHKNPERETIEDALTGNLCRCTGYRSIIEACHEACSQDKSDHFEEAEEAVLEMLGKINTNETLRLSVKGQLYFKPFSIEEALIVRNLHPDALIINGSTDAALLQTKKHQFLHKILDLSGVDELKLIVEDHSNIVFGSGTTLEEVKNYCHSRLPVLTEILSVFGSLQIRNLATLGGNIGSASPIGDTLPVLMSLGAKVSLLGSSLQRELLLEDFITEYRKTSLQPDEIITLIIIPKPLENQVVKSYKISKRHDLDISSVSACYSLQLSNENKVEKISIFYGGMASTTKRATATEGFLTGKRWDRSTIEKAIDIVASEFQPISDARAHASARTIMAKNLLMKFWSETYPQLSENNK